MKTKQLALDAVLAALCAVFGYIGIDLGNLKITFESLPVLVGAFLFGPVDGMAVGLVGTLIYQLLRYGLSMTTPLWLLGYVAGGFLCGWLVKHRRFRLSQTETIAVVSITELTVSLVNTLALYADSRIYGYYFQGFILGSLATRLILCVVKSVAFSLLLPPLLRALKKRGGAA